MSTLEAVYLPGRTTADAQIAFYSQKGMEGTKSGLSELLGQDALAKANEVDFQILLPCEESSLEPITEARSKKGLGTGLRIAPALWQIPGLSFDLKTAMGLLAELDDTNAQPGLCFLIHATRLATTMLENQDFAKVEDGGTMGHAPCWNPQSLRCLSTLSELAPENLLTSRIAAGEDPMFVTTRRNLALAVVSHLIDAGADSHEPGDRQPEPPDQIYWQTPFRPVLEILVPDQELEEGVPWAIQLLLQPVPGIKLQFSVEQVRARIAHQLFRDQAAQETLHKIEYRLEQVARKVPVFHRAISMQDGKASLNRQELDQVLDHLPMLEAEGFEVTLPGFEGTERLTARVTITEDEDGPDGPRPWFVFDWSLAIGTEQLSDEDIERLANANSPLVQLNRGPVLLTPKDREALALFQKRMAESGDRISFFEALRLKLGGATHLHGLALETLHSSPRLEKLVQSLEEARNIDEREQPVGFVGDMRPYQGRGHSWIYFLIDQGFGACLADDMGLGKTIQAIAVMLDWQRRNDHPKPILVVCPVSVLGNWRREINRFAPDMHVEMHHGKHRARGDEEFAALVSRCNVILTSYSLLQRDEEQFEKTHFGGVVLDEAQNIKNPNTRQSKAARALSGEFRLALTGTPLENRPLDLWSIMDFLNEGLLGTKSTFLKTLEHPIIKQRSRSKSSALAKLVRPFVLRRLKTDPDIITDLPDKTEQVVATGLTSEQAQLYEKVVQKGLDEVEMVEGIQRRGAILTTLLRLKQVCNHPAHYQSDGSTLPGRSAKLDLLTEMLEEALAEGDRCLIFTQFKEMGTLLKTHLHDVLQEEVLFLHGGIPQKDREDMVTRFQVADEESPRLFVLSLKAGGTGLNLTAANRVFHYDRWWNPAVEDQATDRAFRIGQQRNVFVHKFVCTGTLEERVQEMLERKREVSDLLLGAGENWLTELDNEELRRLLILDRQEVLS